VPRDLEEVILQCLAKKPGERFQSVKALGEALAACAAACDWGPKQADAWWASVGEKTIGGAPVAPA
jgi:serine/threonine-protein kinase